MTSDPPRKVKGRKPGSKPLSDEVRRRRNTSRYKREQRDKRANERSDDTTREIDRFSDWLRAIIRRSGLSNAELSRRSGVPAANVARFLRLTGSRGMTLVAVDAICRELLDFPEGDAGPWEERFYE